MPLDKNSLIVRAAIEFRDIQVLSSEELIKSFPPNPSSTTLSNIINAGKSFHVKTASIKDWRDVVYSTHPVTGDPLQRIAFDVFDPINLENFLGIRVRAVSAFEKWGGNQNGDCWSAQELISSHGTLVGKGFYIEHRSFDPNNAIGVLVHSQWMDQPEEQFVDLIALIAKSEFPYQADEIRRTLNDKSAGTSIGCIAGEAECGVCGNIAHNKQEICTHMDRSHPMCVKGKKYDGQHMAWDFCRNCTFYEDSYTKAPADRKALGKYVFGAKFDDDVEETPKESKEPKAPTTSIPSSVDISVPDESSLDNMVDRAVKKAFSGRINKLIKTKIEQELGPVLKELQVRLKPKVEQMVEDKKDAVEEAATSPKGGE